MTKNLEVCFTVDLAIGGEHSREAEGKVEFLADGGAAFAKALGLSIDLTERGMGIRSQRYSMVVEDGVVKTFNLEEAPGKAEASGAENLLKSL